MNRLSHFVGDEWLEHSHAPVFDVSHRLVAGAPGGDPLIFQSLVECLAPPFQLLYVLHTPRGEAEPGRYQSPPISLPEFRGFITQFGAFLRSDGRFDLWARSAVDEATVVWDRHNQLFGYGPIQRYSSALHELGFTRGVPVTPSPHEHHYRPEFDEDARKVLLAFEWSRTPLRPEDMQ